MPILFSEYSCLFSAIQFTLPFQKKRKRKGKGKREGRKREKKRITLEWALISYVTRYLRQSVIKTGAWYPYFRSQKPIQKNPTFSKREFSINTLIIYCFTRLSFVKVSPLMRLNRLESRITKALALTRYLYLNIDKDATRVCIAYMSSCFVLVGREGIWESEYESYLTRTVTVSTVIGLKTRRSHWQCCDGRWWTGLIQWPRVGPNPPDLLGSRSFGALIQAFFSLTPFEGLFLALMCFTTNGLTNYGRRALLSLGKCSAKEVSIKACRSTGQPFISCGLESASTFRDNHFIKVGMLSGWR